MIAQRKGGSIMANARATRGASAFRSGRVTVNDGHVDTTATRESHAARSVEGHWAGESRATDIEGVWGRVCDVFACNAGKAGRGHGRKAASHFRQRMLLASTSRLRPRSIAEGEMSFLEGEALGEPSARSSYGSLAASQRLERSNSLGVSDATGGRPQKADCFTSATDRS